jgi:hypothetical protein
LLVSRTTVSFFNKAFLHGAFQIFDDDWHDYIPIFRATGTKYIISKVKGENSEAFEKHFFSDAACHGTSRVISY